MYPANWTKTGLLLMAFLGKHHQLTPKKHTIIIQPLISNQQKFFYNVCLDRNQKKLTNVSLDTNSNNSAATVRMVKDLEIKVYPYITSYAYRDIFEEFYDLIDTTLAPQVLL